MIEERDVGIARRISDPEAHRVRTTSRHGSAQLLRSIVQIGIHLILVDRTVKLNSVVSYICDLQ
jgi:hypothetical protein